MSNALESLDLNYQETTLYITLLSLGKANLSELMHHCNMNIRDVRENSNNLINKGLIEELPGITDFYRVRLPFSQLSKSVQTTLDEIDKGAESFDDFFSVRVREIIEELKDREQKLNSSLTETLTDWENNIPVLEERINQNLNGYVEETTNIITSSKDEIIAEGDRRTNELGEYLNTSFSNLDKEAESVTSNLDQISSKFFDSFTKIDEIVKIENEAKEETNTEIKSSLTSADDEVQNKLSKLLVDIQNLGSDLSTDLEKDSSDLQSHIKEATTVPSKFLAKSIDLIKEKLGDRFITKSTEIRTQLNSTKTQAIEHVLSVQNRFESELQKSTDQLQGTFNQSFPVLEQKISEYISKSQNETKAPIDDIQNSVLEQIQAFSETVENILGSKIDESVAYTSNSVDSLANNVNNLFEDSSKMVENECVNLKDEIKTQLEQINLNSQSNLVKMLDKMKEEININMQAYKGALKEESQQLITSLKSFESSEKDSLEFTEREKYLNKFSNKIESMLINIDKLGSTLQSTIDEQSENLQMHISEATSTPNIIINTNVQKTQSDIQEKLKNTQIDLENNINDLREQTITQLRSSQNYIDTTKNNFVQELSTGISSALKNSKSFLESSLLETQQYIVDQISTTHKSSLEEVNHFLNDLKKFSGSELQSATVELNRLENLGEIIKDSYSTSSDTLIQILESIEDELRNQLSQLEQTGITNVNQVVISISDKLVEKSSRFNETVKTDYQSLSQSIKNLEGIINQHNEKSSVKISNKFDDIKTDLNQKKNEITTNIENTRQALHNIYSTKSKDIQDNIIIRDTNFMEQYSSIIQKNSDNINKRTMVLKSMILENYRSIIEKSVFNTGKTKTIIKEEIGQQLSLIKDGMEDYGEKFQRLALENKESMDRLLELLTNLEESVNKVELSPMLTSPIIKREVVLFYMKNLFDKIRGSITLIIPKPSEIPVNQILDTKLSTRVTLVTAADPYDDFEILNKLLTKPNVRVRTMEIDKIENAESYLAADIDGEEVVIGVEDEENDMVGVVSQNTAFIRLIGQVIIGNFSARSRELKHSDLDL